MSWSSELNYFGQLIGQLGKSKLHAIKYFHLFQGRQPIHWILVSVILLVRLWGALGSHDERHGIESLLFPTLIFAAIWILNVKSGPTVIKFEMSLITLQNSPTSTSTNSLWTSSAGKPAQRSQEKMLIFSSETEYAT